MNFKGGERPCCFIKCVEIDGNFEPNDVVNLALVTRRDPTIGIIDKIVHAHYIAGENIIETVDLDKWKLFDTPSNSDKKEIIKLFLGIERAKTELKTAINNAGYSYDYLSEALDLLKTKLNNIFSEDIDL